MKERSGTLSSDQWGIVRGSALALVLAGQYGNMASACLPIALYQARESGMVKPGSLVLMVAFGSGFVWGSTLLRM